MDTNGTDEQLIRRFAHGDRAALGALAEQYEGPLLGLAAGLLGREQTLARDAVQETWLRVIRFGDRFDGRSSFKTWLYRIAINQCNSLRAARPAFGGEKLDASAKSNAQAPDAAAESAESRRTVREAVDQLGADQRLVVLLCYHEGMTHTQAAEILEIPVGTLKSRLHAALTDLRERLSSETQS